MGTLEMVKELLASGSGIGSLDDNEQTPAHRAAQQGRREIVCLLLDHGFDKETQDGFTIKSNEQWSKQTPEEFFSWHRRGRTLLHYAAAYGHKHLAAD